MGFPVQHYEKAIAELQATVLDRDAKGRNETNDFYSQFPHGVSDLTFELYRRVQRILGAEKIGDMETVYGDTLDLANYAVFLMMLLKAKTSSASSPQPSAGFSPFSVYPAAQGCIQPLDSTILYQNNGCNTHQHDECLYQSPPVAAQRDTADACSHL